MYTLPYHLPLSLVCAPPRVILLGVFCFLVFPPPAFIHQSRSIVPPASVPLAGVPLAPPGSCDSLICTGLCAPWAGVPVAGVPLAGVLLAAPVPGCSCL